MEKARLILHKQNGEKYLSFEIYDKEYNEFCMCKRIKLDNIKNNTEQILRAFLQEMQGYKKQNFDIDFKIDFEEEEENEI